MKLRATYGSRFEKVRDFLIGFAGWFVVGGVIVLAVRGFSWSEFEGVDQTGLCLTPLNVIALITLAFTRRWMALGWLAAYALNLVVTLIMSQYAVGAACGFPFFTPLQWY